MRNILGDAFEVMVLALALSTIGFGLLLWHEGGWHRRARSNRKDKP